MRFIIVVFLILVSECTFAQGEANIWYFGSNAGVDFNGGAPVALTNGALNTIEGCASISDKNGNLIFYTDGIFVYNRNHQQMPNGFGLFGNPTAAQSGLIVPQPGNPNLFIVFTVDGAGGPNGFRYSEVDMTLDNGNGDVIAANKNTLLFAPSVEKLTAVKHDNGLDVWVLSHGLNNNRYYAYLVDCDGVNSPVISDIGSVEGAPGWGYLTASPNGVKLASAMRTVGFELYDFDRSTGIVSNPINLGQGGSCYGVAFSPNNNLLYGLSIQGGALVQWNLQAGTPADIINSAQNLGAVPGTGTPYRGGAIQQGPDEKLYLPDYGRPFLTAINNPNVVGPGCNVQPNAVNLQGRNAILGLPPFIQSFFDTTLAINYSGTCIGQPTDFTISGNTTFFDSVRWHFDDPISGPQNTSTQLNPSHNYTIPGSYNVALIKYLACIVDTSLQEIVIPNRPLSNQNVSICANDSFSLPSGTVVYSAGIYNDTISDLNGCDSIVVTDLSIDPVYSTELFDTICQGETFMLPNGNPVNATGTYNSDFSSINGCDSTVITNLIVNPISASIVNPEICENETYTLPSGGIVDSSDTYLDTLQNQFGCDSVITINLTVHPIFTDSLDIMICENESHILPDGNAVDSAGVYNTMLSSVQDCDSLIVTTLVLMPVFQTDVFDTICLGENYILPDGRSVDSEGEYLNELSSQSACDSLVNIILTVLNPSAETQSEDITCFGANDGSARVSGGGSISPYNYEWETGNATNAIDGLSPGAYSITVQDAFGCADTVSVVINEPDSLTFTISTQNVSCFENNDGTISINPSGGTAPYQLLVNGNAQTSTTANNLPAGSYSLEVLDENNCSSSTSVELTRPDSIAYSYEPENPEMELGETLEMFFSSNYDPMANYIWESTEISCNNCNDPGINFTASDSLRGAIEVMSDNQTGIICSRDISVFIEVDDSRNLFFPNAFSPNGDGENDLYRIYGNFNSVRTFSFRIFDRWGELVFESDDPEFSWDGNLSNGTESYIGVYTYSAVYSFLGSNQEVKNIKGSITLIR
ncbi:MAG: gliding motility-associated C-terminal domain-containing protein [Chitinophagales bacterium]